MTHTRGPWAVNPSSAEVNCGTLCDCGCGGLLPVAQMLWPTEQRSEDETFANARLIASAPDLLAACQALLDRYRIMVAADGPECLLARAAITKALGSEERA